MKQRIAFALLLVLVQLPAWRTGLFVADEGWIAHTAQRLARGEALYRDVHSYLPPLTYWVLELPMRIRPSLLWGRLIALSMTAALGYLAVTIVEGFGRHAQFAAVSGIAVLGALGYPSYTIPSYTGLSLACGLAGWLLWEEGRSPLLCGLALAAALGFKQTTGLAACLAIVLAQVLDRRLAWVRIGLGVASGSALMVARLLMQGALGSALHALSPATMAQYGSMGRMPAPGWSALSEPRLAYTIPFVIDVWTFPLSSKPLWLMHRLLVIALYYLPIPLALAACIAVPKPKRKALLSLTLFALATYATLWPRADVTHLLQVLPPTAILAAILFGSVVGKRAVTAIALLALGASFAIQGARRAAFSVPLAVPHDGGIKVSPVQAPVRDVILGLREHTGEPMLAAPWGAIYYLLADRPNPTPYELLLPGNIGPAEKRSIMATVSAHPPHEIVWSSVDLRNLTPVRFEDFFPDLVTFRDAHYELVHRSPGGMEELWRLRPPR